jgi:hypothetical protein
VLLSAEPTSTDESRMAMLSIGVSNDSVYCCNDTCEHG